MQERLLDRYGWWVALATVVAGGTALRALGLSYGLPFPLLDPDEGNIVPRAWAIGHGDRLDPAFYDYPSLLFYLLAPLQAAAEAPSYLAARAVTLTVGICGVGATWWLGRRAYGYRAALIGAACVAVATTHVAYSRIAVTDVLLTVLVTGALAAAVAGRIEWAGVLVGLAASAKYPGALAAVPLLVAGWPRWRPLLRAAALAVAAFAVTSPFVLLHAGRAWEDVDRVQRFARDGWLGFEDDPPSLVAFADRLWEAVGPIGVVAAIGLLLALRRGHRADVVLGSFVVTYAIYLASLGAHFDRYVLPLVPVAGVLAGSVRRIWLLSLALVLVPLAWSIRDGRELLRTDTRLLAYAWIEANVARDAAIAADPSTLPLEGRPAVLLELPGPGRPSDARRSLASLRGLGVEYVLVSGAVTDRVRAARDRYPLESRFYDELDRRATVAYEVDPRRPGLAGPWVRLYRL
jgi:4-amino-4-deoxy-L-arabinose transferase-like glycosyltransferase